MKDRELTVVPMAGLANRMRAVASGYALSEATDRTLTVIWQKAPELMASFTDLFKPQDLFEVREVSRPIFQLYYDSPRKKNLFLPQILHLFSRRRWVYFISEKNAYMTDEYFLELAQKDIGHINVMTCYPFYDRFNKETINKIFQPSLKVEERIKEILNNEEPDIAVQIRRTDHCWAIEKSPTSKFEEIVEREIRENPDIKLYLATDDQGIKNHFKEKYSGNIIFNPEEARRDTKEGMIDGAAEMFIMSKCRKIYGSYNSSYSEFAAQMGGAELEVVGGE